MQLPLQIEQVIESLTQGIPLATLAKHFQYYSQAYREGKPSQASLPSQIEKICYLATRLPATLGAAAFVLTEYERRMGKAASLIDFGAGPGTTLISALELGWVLKEATLIEKSSEFIELGKQWLPSWVTWKKADLNKLETFPTGDLGVFSYSLGEMPERDLNPLLNRAWDACQKALIIIEPGTPRGFKRLLYARDFLLGCAGQMVAPCPCNSPCPMPKNDWCHFSVRIPRTSLHRRIKGAQLGYEDEKFCYVIIAKEAASPCHARVLKTPQNHPGRVLLTLCTPQGIQNKIVSKRDGEIFKQAKKLDWGDAESF